MDSFQSHSESGYNLQRTSGGQQNNDMNRMPHNDFGQQLRSEAFMNEGMNYASVSSDGHLRRPIMSNNEPMVDLAQQTNLLSLHENARSNDNNYNSIGGGDVTNNTLSWISSGYYQYLI